jgi:hypothetical protein
LPIEAYTAADNERISAWAVVELTPLDITASA